MDFLLIIYFIIFFIILVYPFYKLKKTQFMSQTSQIELEDLKLKRKLLLENLKDLKTDMQTGKLSKQELEQASIEIVKELEEIDSKIPNLSEK